MKVQLIVFLDFNGIMHHELLQFGKTINEEYYLRILRQLREVIRQQSPFFGEIDHKQALGPPDMA